MAAVFLALHRVSSHEDSPHPEEVCQPPRACSPQQGAPHEPPVVCLHIDANRGDRGESLTSLPLPTAIGAPHRRGGGRGFTLLELMVVITIVGITFTLATPSIRRQLRNRRGNQAAHEVSLLYRAGRARALGRGAAVLVRFTKTAGSQGKVELFEASNPGGGQNNGQLQGLPATSCQNTTWTGDTAGVRAISSFDPSLIDAYSNVTMTFLDSAGTERSIADLCFSPLGRPYLRYADTGAFASMAEVPYVQVAPIDGAGIVRTVLVLPNGASRLTL